jgi:hypothetical protein
MTKEEKRDSVAILAGMLTDLEEKKIDKQAIIAWFVLIVNRKSK